MKTIQAPGMDMGTPKKVVVPKKLQLTNLGEIYNDLLCLDCWLNDDSPAAQARYLLRSKLMQREGAILERVSQVARKRGIDPDTFRLMILKGEAQEIEASEIVIDGDKDDES